MNDDDLKACAERRHALHLDHHSSRPLSRDYELVGLAGESAFAEALGLEVDTADRPGGDGGRDFEVAVPFRVDVKTARKPYYLLLEEGKPAADVVVLAEYRDETGRATLLGWVWGRELLAAPVKDFGCGVMDHHIPRSKLRPMERLLAWLRRGKRG